MDIQNIAIIGAGSAGISAAKAFIAAGHEVTLLDKANRAGGRTSTRTMQTELGELIFDHGAPYFQVTDRGFRVTVQDWEDQGLVEPWQRDIQSFDAFGELIDSQSNIDWLAIPKMESLMQILSQSMDVRFGHRVSKIEQSKESIRLEFENDIPAQVFGRVICAIPAEQAAVLLEGAQEEFAAKAKAIDSDPCWVTMVSFNAPVDFHASEVKIEGEGIISKAIAQHRKPGRESRESWLIQSSAKWSIENLERDKTEIAAEVSHEFCSLFDLSEPDFMTSHRWRYSQPANLSDIGYLYNECFGVCGDWLLGGDLEGAWLSGHRLAKHMIAKMK